MPFPTFRAGRDPFTTTFAPAEVGILLCFSSPLPGCWVASSSLSAPLCQCHQAALCPTWLSPLYLCTLQLPSPSKHFPAVSAESENASVRAAAASPRGNALLGNNYREFKQGRLAAKLLHAQAPGQQGRVQKQLFGTARKHSAPALIVGVQHPWAGSAPGIAAPSVLIALWAQQSRALCWMQLHTY